MRDIWLIAESVGDVAEPWYSDPEVIADRKLAFAREQQTWMQAGESRRN